jgi:beta-1,4-mannosyl-glycoprotein beta-1,4-N-acetylglucosaminyltransferase
MKIDCFIFYNELELLTYRFHLLNEVVDYFILVESTHAFIGTPKKLVYQENKHLFDAWNHKIIHIVVEDFPHVQPVKKENVWNNEIFQRNAISRGISSIPLHDSDIILISDVDEIPDPRTLRTVQEVTGVQSLHMDMYYYNLNTKLKTPWTKSKMLSYRTYRELKSSCDALRNMKGPLLFKGGWHLSYFGDDSFISDKIQHFSHQELNKYKYTNEQNIRHRVQHQLDLFGRRIPIQKISISKNDYLPPDYALFLTKYHFLE